MYDIHRKLTKIPMIVATRTFKGQMVHLIEKLLLIGYNIIEFVKELSALILFTRNQPFNPFEANISFLYPLKISENLWKVEKLSYFLVLNLSEKR